MGNIISVGINNLIHILAWSAEVLALLLCNHAFSSVRIKVNRTIFLVVGTDIALFELIKVGILPEVFTGVMHIIICLYVYKTFGMKFVGTIGRYVLSMVVVGAFEIISSFILTIFDKYIQQQEFMVLPMNMLSLLFSILLYKIIIGKCREPVDYYNIQYMVVISVSGVCMLFLILDYHRNKELIQIYYLVLMGLMTFAYFYWGKTQKTRLELEKKKLEMELQDVYGDAYKELMYEVRRKQHDFANQLGAIYSMHITAISLEDLVRKQSEYADILKKQCKYDKILTSCNNPILAGYLYYKCINLEKTNIDIDYSIHTDTAECCLPLHELIEVLGIFLANAKEEFERDEKEPKKIKLVVTESTDHLLVEVGNPSPYITMEKAGQLFQNGCSSKGKNRGIGLYRVKQLMKKCKADIIVENRTESGQNWIFFRVIIPN